MVDIVKQDMTHLWAISGDVVAPDDTKIEEGWSVEVVPRQWWNWMQYRADSNIAYMLQKGIPEWDATTEYRANKSFVSSGGVVYKCLITNTGLAPLTNPTQWSRAFADYTVSLNALGALTPAADRMPYFTNGTTAALTTITSFARTLLDDTTSASARSTLGAQASSGILTALAAVPSPAVNTMPYWTSATSMDKTALTAFGRDILAGADSASVRSTLELGSSATYNVNTAVYGSPAVATLGSVVLRNGSFGLGSTDLADMPSGTDWNTINATGFYQMNANGNGSAGYSGQMIVMTNATNYITQLFSPQDTTGRLYVRSSSAGTFSPWNNVWTTGNLVKTTDATDTTTGSVLQVGDFGLGAASTPSLASLDTPTVSGFYRAAGETATSSPESAPLSVLQSQFNTGGAMQMASALTTGGGLYWRIQAGGTWRAWSQVASVNFVNTSLALKANLASPALTGTPTAPTAGIGTNSTQIATTAFVQAAKRNYSTSVAGLSTSTTLTVANSGTVYQWNANNVTTTLPSPASAPAGTTYYFRAVSGRTGCSIATSGGDFIEDGSSVATLSVNGGEWIEVSNNSSSWFVTARGRLLLAVTDAELQTSLALKANLASPVLTGTPTAPTAATATNNTQIATTAFVKSALASGNAATATTATSAAKWTTARTLTLTGAASGSVSFDGSANITLNTTLGGSYYTTAQSNARYAVNGSTGSNSYLNVTNTVIPTLSNANDTYGPNSLRVSNGGNTAASAVLSFVREGSFATWFGLDTDNQLAWGGWSHGANRYVIWSEKNFNVRNHNAQLGTGELGTYALMVVGGGGGIEPGSTVAGGNLRFASAAASTSAAGPVGTWRLMGYVTNADGASSDSTTLCLRIA